MIVGSVADDKVVNTVELYSDRLISKEESLRRLKYYKPNFQIDIINQEVINDYLNIRKLRDIIEVNKIITANICKIYRKGLVKETHITEEGTILCVKNLSINLELVIYILG